MSHAFSLLVSLLLAVASSIHMEMGLSLDGSSFSFTFDTETHPEKVANELVAKFSDSLTEGAGCVRGGRACLVAAVASVIERQVEQRRLDGWLELGTTITWFLKLNPSNPRFTTQPFYAHLSHPSHHNELNRHHRQKPTGYPIGSTSQPATSCAMRCIEQ